MSEPGKHVVRSIVPTIAIVLWYITLYPGIGQTAEPPPQTATIFGVGDIMQCASPEGAELTGRLMERLLNETRNSIGITLGDNSNDNGTEDDYLCFDRSSWGRLMARLRPTPGNHDYGVDKLLPFYYLYFPNAGPTRLGYSAFNFGPWRVYSINSELVSPELRQEQLNWLEQDLHANSKDRCTLAYFHRPPFSSGDFASPAWVLPIFRKLYKYGVDLVVTGHEHFFASLPPLNPSGDVEKAYGVPLLISGTGGARFFDKPKKLKYGQYGEMVVARTLGVVRIDLKPAGYDWAFVPVNPGDQAPSGSGGCHNNPPGYVD